MVKLLKLVIITNILLPIAYYFSKYLMGTVFEINEKDKIVASVLLLVILLRVGNNV